MSLVQSPAATMKSYRGKLPLSIITVLVCSFAIVALLYTERLSSFSSSSIFKLSSCPKRNHIKKSSKLAAKFCYLYIYWYILGTLFSECLLIFFPWLIERCLWKEFGSMGTMYRGYPRFLILMICCHCVTEDKSAEQNIYNTEIDDRFDFDPEECNVVNGKWVFNSSIKPLYSDRTCPYLDRQVSCVKNGRPDSDYRHWEWQPEDCTLPRLKDLANFMFSILLGKLYLSHLLHSIGDSLCTDSIQSLPLRNFETRGYYLLEIRYKEVNGNHLSVWWIQ